MHLVYPQIKVFYTLAYTQLETYKLAMKLLHCEIFNSKPWLPPS